jgi:hypothetical protein
MIPYSAEKQLDALQAGVAAIAESDAWVPLEARLLPEVVGGLRLDTTAPGPDGQDWHRVHIVGLRDRNLVAIAWSQPAAEFDERLLEQVLLAIELPSAPAYSDGDLVDSDAGQGIADYRFPIPGHWSWVDQPTLDGVPLSGIRRWAEGRVVVSLGSADGELAWCDPTCRVATEQTSLEALEATIRDGRDLGPSESTTLGGEPARTFGSDRPVERRYVVAMHHGRPVAVLVDVGDWDVAPGIVTTMLEGFRFTDRPLAEVGAVYTTADGAIELRLPSDWRQDPRDDAMFHRGVQRMTVQVGDAAGSITTCDRPAGPWDRCRVVTVSDLEELVAAIQPGPEDDHGVGPPTGVREDVELDGTPGVVTRIQAYEYPARSGQEVVYIAAFHGERPVLVRVWTSENVAQGVDEIVGGLRFVDPDAATPKPAYTTGDGRVALELDGAWKEMVRNDHTLSLERGLLQVMVAVGEPDGTVLPCVKRAAPWEWCEPIKVEDLDDMAVAVAPRPVADHGVGPPIPERTSGTLDGEPAMIMRVPAYEYPAQGGQEVVYVGAFHRGRPYILRIRTTANRIGDLEAMIARFRFVD